MMDDRFFNKTNLIVFLLVVLVVIVLTWLILPRTSSVPQEMHPTMASNEHFGEGTQEMQATPEADKNKPFVNPQVGTIMDGPGFEKGDVDGVSQETMSNIPSNYYFLDDGAGGEMEIQHNLCSKSCCSAQWPTPFKQKFDPYVCGAKNSGEFIPSQIFCNNSFQDSGCLCLTKKQGQFLYNRGGNGREWF